MGLPLNDLVSRENMAVCLVDCSLVRLFACLTVRLFNKARWTEHTVGSGGLTVS